MSNTTIFRTGTLGPLPRQCWRHGAIENLSDTSSFGDDNECIALLDSRALLLTEAVIPTRRRKRALAAAAYAIEDQIAGDVEPLHLGIGAVDEAGAYPLAAISRNAIEDLLDWLDREGLYPDLLLPDALALPWSPGTWSVMLIDDAVLVRTGRASGVSCDTGVATAILESLARQPPDRIELLGPTSPALDQLAEWAGSRNYEVLRSRVDQPVLGILAEGMGSAARDMNLLTGSYRRLRTTSADRQIRVAAGLVLALTLFGTTNSALDLSRANQANDDLRTQITDAYLAVAPTNAPVIDPLRQLTAMVTELRSGTRNSKGLLHLLAALTALDRPELAKVAIEAIEFDDTTLDIRVTAPSSQALDEFADGIHRAGGLETKVVSASQVESGTLGQLRITGVRP